jgi:hypothetical protein
MGRRSTRLVQDGLRCLNWLAGAKRRTLAPWRQSSNLMHDEVVARVTSLADSVLAVTDGVPSCDEALSRVLRGLGLRR